MNVHLVSALAVLFVAPLSPAKKPTSKHSAKVQPLPSDKSKSKSASKGKTSPSKGTSKGKATKGSSRGPLHIKPLPKNQHGDVTLRGAVKRFPKFPALDRLREQAQDNQIVPQNDPSALRELARLSAGNPREGSFAYNVYCGTVLSDVSLGDDGFTLFPHRLIDFCRDQGLPKAGVEVVFTAQAGRAYAVDCTSAANTRFRIRHKLGGNDWSPTTTVTTRTPREFVLTGQTAEARVKIEFDPTNNHILTQSIKACRVSQIGD